MKKPWYAPSGVKKRSEMTAAETREKITQYLMIGGVLAVALSANVRMIHEPEWYLRACLGIVVCAIVASAVLVVTRYKNGYL